MPGPDSNTEEIREDDSTIERFDHDGNVIIVVEGQPPENTRRFLVSSKVLGLASPVFAKLFSPNFHEGTKLANDTCPEISLHDDDPAAMGAIIAILHYQEPNEIAPTDAKWLAILAIHCDKYDCVKAMRAWVSTWFHHFQSIPTSEDYGHLIVAAHLFRNAEHFSKLTAKAQLGLRPGFALEWEKSEIMHRLPDPVKL
ncbi:hypothetical protein N7524_011856 [Penicillium chrysogenum]|nr:hypothetical protein N7524_011856 [Penicillium chrysogenum]